LASHPHPELKSLQVWHWTEKDINEFYPFEPESEVRPATDVDDGPLPCRNDQLEVA